MVRNDEESEPCRRRQRQRGRMSDAERDVLDSFSMLRGGGVDFPNVTCQWKYYTSLTFEMFFQRFFSERLKSMAEKQFLFFFNVCVCADRREEEEDSRGRQDKRNNTH